MTEYSGKSDEEMASAFIVSTCQLLTKQYSLTSDHMHNLIRSRELAPKHYSIVSGSEAEFYIRPLNGCIMDIDYLLCKADELAFSGNFPVLPSDLSGLSDTIACYEIESYFCYPGFVRIRFSGDMNYNWKHKKYEFNRTAHPRSYMVLNMDFIVNNYIAHYPHILDGCTLPSIVSGPAVKSQNDTDTELKADAVKSLFCPRWPGEAKNWPFRPRKYGWPTIDTISEVVQNGCHVVYAQHRSCRDDKLQWRLSFSVAEVILLQSLTHFQQIVYHLLRFFCKRVLIEKDCPKEDEVLCPYHLKTLILWTCEEMSPHWWNSTSVIVISCELLKILSKWLKRRYCPNYFIPEANLFHEHWNPKMLDKTERRLNEFCNSGILCHWLVENYILPITRPQFKFLNTKNGLPHFMDYLLPLLEYRKTHKSVSLDILFCVKFFDSHQKCRQAIKWGFNSGLCQSLKFGQYAASLNSKLYLWFNCLPATEKVLCFKYYNGLLYILHTAYGLRYREILWDSSLFVEFVQAISTQPKIIRSQYHNFPKSYTTQSSRFQFLRAQNLMQNLTGSNSKSEFQLVSLLSKQFIRKAFEYEGYVSNGIAPAALAYLAALHFATSEYQQSIRFCSAVFEEHTPQKVHETLNIGCLLFIDDVARIVGLRVLYKKITENNLHYISKRIFLDLRLSPEVFAHYLTALSAEKICKHFDYYHDLPDSAYPMDEYLKAVRKPKSIAAINSGIHLNATRQRICGNRSSDSMTETVATYMNPLMVKEIVIDALMEYALENMTSFYSMFHKDFGLKCNTADCYRALHLYKCRQYDEVLNLCERILHEPDLQNDLKAFVFANVSLLPPLDSFFDGDVQSLLGFHTLFYYLSPLNDEILTSKGRPIIYSTFAHWFAYHVYFHKVELSHFLIKWCYSTKCYYFLGRHFLARYLKVRCCIDCNLPHEEAMTEFTYQETNLPFEHIIRRFLLQKHRIIKQ